MPWTVYILFFIFFQRMLTALPSYNCEFLTRLLSGEKNRGDLIADYYEKLLIDILVPTLPHSALEKMLKAKTPMEIPVDTIVSSQTAFDSLKEFREIVSGEVEQEKELRNKILDRLEKFLNRGKQLAEKQKKADRRISHLRPVELSNNVHQFFSYGKWIVEKTPQGSLQLFKMGDQSSNKVKIDILEKLAKSVGLKNPIMDPRDGSLFFLQKRVCTVFHSLIKQVNLKANSYRLKL